MLLESFKLFFPIADFILVLAEIVIVKLLLSYGPLGKDVIEGIEGDYFIFFEKAEVLGDVKLLD